MSLRTAYIVAVSSSGVQFILLRFITTYDGFAAKLFFQGTAVAIAQSKHTILSYFILGY